MGVSSYGISYHEEYSTIPHLEETKAFIAENMEPGDVVVYDTDSRFGQLFGCYMPDQIFYTMEEVPDLEELVGKRVWYFQCFGHLLEESDKYTVTYENMGHYGFQYMDGNTDFDILKVNITEETGNDWVERGILLAAILSMLFVWPYGGIREDKNDSSLSEDYGYTEPLQEGEYASQYFVAETDFLETLEIAVNYNEEEARNGLLGLEIWKEDQKIYEGVIPYDAMESATFFPAVIETWLKKGAVYEYRIVNQSISENLPQVVYTTTEKAHVLENQQLVVHGTIVNGQALNRYTWRKKLDVVSVLEIDSFIAILAAMIYAVLEQWKGKKEQGSG